MNDSNEILFWSVFRNKYLFYNIFKIQLKLLLKNNNVEINNLKDLLEYKDREYITNLYYSTYERLKEHYIPSGVEKLVFWDNFNNEDEPISKNCIPNSVLSLEFGSDFTNGGQPLMNLPSNLQRIILGDRFNSSLICNLPRSIQVLILGDSYNQEITGLDSLTSLKKLKFGDNFNKKFPTDIPDSLETVILGLKYNMPFEIKQNQFTSLHTVLFGDSFNSSSLRLPESITILKFGKKYNQINFKDCLPKSLTVLRFGMMFNQPFKENSLPHSITTLELGLKYNYEFLPNVLPKSLITLEISRNYKYSSSLNQPNILASSASTIFM